MAEIIPLHDHPEYEHTYGECKECGNLEWAILINPNEEVIGFRCLYCKVVGVFGESVEICFELEE